ncbi:hypothetical protein [Leeuwenhoekiella sp. NPDC079379]|uniref:hypothetical protein n=1 Tax=Leeuwenhoekiella sp. NPDC079379 TaxID=3364122 RepID=UPI0037C974E4
MKLFSFLDSKIVARVSTLFFFFSILSSIAKLNSVNKAIHFIEEKNNEIAKIIDLLRSSINLILIPYRYIRDFFFSIIPVEIPFDWQDAIIIAFIIFLVPLLEFRYFIRFGNNFHNPSRTLRKIFCLLKEPIKLSEYSNISLKINKILDSNGIGKSFKNVVKLKLSSLLINLSEKGNINSVELGRLEYIEFYNQELKPFIRNLRSTKLRKQLLFNRTKIKIAFLLLFFISIDSFRFNEELIFFDILWKSFLLFIIFGVIPLIILITLLGIFFFISAYKKSRNDPPDFYGSPSNIYEKSTKFLFSFFYKSSHDREEDEDEFFRLYMKLKFSKSEK